MPLHLIKLCVGVAKVETLQRRVGKGQWLTVHTRHAPKRADEILDGGSLYWVFKGVVLARMPIADIRTIEDGARRRCEIILAPEVIRTEGQPRRAFQGWRYLDAADAPPDAKGVTDQPDDMPPGMREELRELRLIDW